MTTIRTRFLGGGLKSRVALRGFSGLKGSCNERLAINGPYLRILYQNRVGHGRIVNFLKRASVDIEQTPELLETVVMLKLND